MLETNEKLGISSKEAESLSKEMEDIKKTKWKCSPKSRTQWVGLRVEWRGYRRKKKSGNWKAQQLKLSSLNNRKYMEKTK